MLRRILFPVLFVVFAVAVGSAQESRHFTFHYAFTVKNVTPGQPVRIWIPMAHSDAYQEVKVLSANGDLPLKKTHESKFGNEMFYAEDKKAKAAELAL